MLANAQQKVLVRFESADLAASTLSAFAKTQQSKRQATVIHQFRSSGASTIYFINSERSASDWEKIPGVLETQQSKLFPEARDVIPNDPDFPIQWNMEIIEAAGAWDYSTGGFTATGTPIVVGVIEVNGFQLDHPELEGQYYINEAEIADNGIDDDNNGYIDDVTGWNFYDGRPGFEKNNHGVHTCATLAAKGNNGEQIAGVNWDLDLLPFEVNGVDDWILALDYLTDLREKFNRSNGSEGAFVVAASMSIGIEFADCSEFPFFNPALERAGNAGILLVGSTGNSGGEITNTRPDFPSTCQSDFLIVVTSSDELDQVVADSRTSDEHVDIAAPGATYPSVEYSATINTFGGTSGATPHVAGAIALMYSTACEELEELAKTDPAETARMVKSNLFRSVDKNFRFRDKVTTGGRLNLRKAMEAMTKDVGLASCVETSNRCELLPTFENPLTSGNETTIYLISPGTSECRVILSDALGRTLLQTDNLPAGLNSIDLPVSGLSNQVLYLQVGDPKIAKGIPLMILGL